MKKAISIALLSFYILSIVGFNVDIHHCAGIDSYQIFGIDFNKDCDCEHQDVNHSSKCCNNENVIVKGIDAYKISNNSSFKFEDSYKWLVTPSSLFDPILICKEDGKPKFIKPDYPPRYHLPIYLINRVILI